MKGKWLLIGGALIILALGAGALSLLRRQQTAASAIVPSSAGAVQFTGPTASLPGRIEALEVVTVAVPFEGKIEKLAADVGQDVSEGQLLAEIRSSDLEAERNNATAELTRLRTRAGALESTLIAARLEASKASEAAASAQTQMDGTQKELQRQQMLFGKGAAAKQSVDKAQAAFETARARYEGLGRVSSIADGRVEELTKELDAQEKSLNQKTKDVEDTEAQVAAGDVKSPVDGYIIARRGQEGDQVTADIEDLFQIAVNVAQLKVVVAPPPPVLEKIRAGQDVLIQIAEVASPVESKVTDVRDGQVVIEFTSPDAVIKPGMTVQVVIKLT